MVALTKVQQEILATNGHQLVTGGPGSGKTTVSILKAGALAREVLRPGQRVLFLSFARATVGRVLQAITEEASITAEERSLIVVDTYHSFFWQILRTHGYLLGLPRKLSVLTPPAEAIALSAIRSEFGPVNKLSVAAKAERNRRESAEQNRLALEEGLVCFDLFAPSVAKLLHSSVKIRRLISTMYPVVVLDEFQDTNAEQWGVVKAIGEHSLLVALADPEQRIYDFIGADPERLGHFTEAFKPTLHDLSQDNHRSKGTDIALFGNDILVGRFRQSQYQGIDGVGFASNANQAYHVLMTTTLQARRRLIESGKLDWSLAILVPTKRMVRTVSDYFTQGFGTLPAIEHAASVDMEGPILAAEILAFLLQQGAEPQHFDELISLMCRYFHGRHGDAPTKGDLEEARKLRAALDKRHANEAVGKRPPANSILNATALAFANSCFFNLTGDPDKDWTVMRRVLEESECARLQEVAQEVRNVRLLRRGTQLRSLLKQDWEASGAYRNALEIIRQSFVQEHFATAHKPEAGVVVMNMHKAKGKQFDEVIIFEGWPVRHNGQIVANTDRIVRYNQHQPNMTEARQCFRVSVTRAKSRTTIMSPADDPCVLLLPQGD